MSGPGCALPPDDARIPAGLRVPVSGGDSFLPRHRLAGVDLKTVQELMGHKSITMTARYAHLSPEHRMAALEKLCPSATSSATAPETATVPVAPMVQ